MLHYFIEIETMSDGVYYPFREDGCRISYYDDYSEAFDKMCALLNKLKGGRHFRIVCLETGCIITKHIKYER